MVSEEYSIDSSSSDQTEQRAADLGAKLRGGEVIELVGDVGAGKTTFVRGLARGLDSSDRVSSPTFTIYQVYRGRLPLYHFDLYRLHGDGMVQEELTELIDRADAVVVVEWASNMAGTLPKQRICISFETTGETDRVIRIEYPKKQEYMQ